MRLGVLEEMKRKSFFVLLMFLKRRVFFLMSLVTDALTFSPLVLI